MVAALEFAARSLGVDWRTETAQLVVDGNEVTVETPTATISTGVVVIAGGAWTTELASAFGMRTGVRPVRGQIVHLHLDADTGSWPVLQPIRSHYVVPFRDGRVALGATVEDVGFEVRPTASGIAELFSEGLRLSPGLADATFLEVRVGLRPVSDDDLPVIGALPGAENVYVASGHGANGLLLGPVTGRVVAGLVSAQRTGRRSDRLLARSVRARLTQDLTSSQVSHAPSSKCTRAPSRCRNDPPQSHVRSGANSEASARSMSPPCEITRAASVSSTWSSTLVHTPT